MTFMKNTRIIVSLLLLAAVTVLLPERLGAQAGVAYDAFSPYSMYGVGSLETLGSQNSLAMGGIAIGDRNNAYINWVTPAAVTARENRAFMLDFGVTQKNILYTADAVTSIEDTDSGTLRSVNNMFNIHHILVSFPIIPTIAFKAGLMPFAATASALSGANLAFRLTVASEGRLMYSSG